MPHFKPVHQGLKLLPVDFDKQILSFQWPRPWPCFARLPPS
jgi:hypothetical protein